VGLGLSTIDEKLTAAIQTPVQQINDRLDISELDSWRFWHALVASPTSDDPARVEHALLRAGCSELAIDSISPAILGRLTDARLAFRGRFPKLAEQLPLRAGPLRDLWDSSGPGLLREIGRRTIATLIPPKTTLLLVQPIRGGDGGLLDRSDTVWVEAVLAHPETTIPETLRIAWLVARKGIDRIESNRWVASDRLPHVAAMALVPIVLAAGEELGLTTSTDSQIGRTLDLWHLDSAHAKLPVEPLLRWWSQMRDDQLPLPVALKALDKML
jgi:hypothetical protein